MYLLADLIVILVFLIGAATLGFLLGRRSMQQRAAEQQNREVAQRHRLADAQTKLKRTLAQRMALEQELTEVRTHLSGRGIAVADIRSAPQETKHAAPVTSPADSAKPIRKASRTPGQVSNEQRTIRPASVATLPQPPSKQDEILRRIRARADKIDFARLGTAEEGRGDDLKRIESIGIFTEKKLNALGIRTFEQLAKLNERDQRIVNWAVELSPGRVARDGWVAQAKQLKEDGIRAANV